MTLWECAGKFWRVLTPVERADILNREKLQYKSWSSTTTETQKAFMESVKSAGLCKLKRRR